MSIDERMLKEALVFQPAGDEDGPTDVAIEKMGDETFDWLRGEFDKEARPSTERIRALRLMSRITRQFCVARKGELVDVAMSIAQDGAVEPELRSAATHIAIMSSIIARGLGQPTVAFGGRTSQDVHAQVVLATRRALELGLSTEMASFATEFLSRGDTP